MPRDPRRRRLLVVDDEPAVRDLITLRLELAGYHVDTARDGYEALERLSGPRPEAMILDVNMPRMDGFEVLRSVDRLGIARVPTMVLTARNAADDVRTAIGLGARDFLAKPFRDDQLLTRVARLLRPTRPGVSSLR